MLRLAILTFVLTLPLPVLAQQQYDRSEASQAEQQACEPDVYRLCHCVGFFHPFSKCSSQFWAQGRPK